MISIDGQLTSSLLVTDHIENTGSRGPPCYCWQHKLLHPGNFDLLARHAFMYDLMFMDCTI